MLPPKIMTNFKQLIIASSLLLLAACNDSESPRSQKIIVLGDSVSTGYNIAESWANRLQKRLNVTLNNHSVNGEQTEYGLANITPLLEQQQPTHLIIMLGTNDVYKGSPEVAIDNLSAMVKIASQYDTQIIMLTIPPSLGPTKAQQSTQKINQAISAMPSNVTVVDVFSAFQNASNKQPKTLLHDKVHPNEAGQELIFKTVLTAFKTPKT